jgi:hypothetical protein
MSKRDDVEHPMQPVVLDKLGTPRFKGNAIIERLFRERRIDLNQISMWDVPVEDAEQFWQLLGYSVSGYGELSFIRPETVAKADEVVEALLKAQG